MAGHGVTAIEVGEHEGSRICVRHDHLRNQRREDRQQHGPGRARANAGIERAGVQRDAQPVQSDAGSSTIGPGQSSRQSRRERLNRSKLTRWGQ